MKHDADELIDMVLYWLDRVSPDFLAFVLTVLLGGAGFWLLGRFL